ncbi:hypothetical protein K438DRAFT_1846910, partial [Mycena galopus ATCC 62051]
METNDDDGLSFWFKQHRAHLDPMRAPKTSPTLRISESTMGYTGPTLEYTLQLMRRDKFSQDGSPLNRSIAKLTNGKSYHSWAGNLIAYCIDELTTLVARCRRSGRVGCVLCRLWGEGARIVRM